MNTGGSGLVPDPSAVGEEMPSAPAPPFVALLLPVQCDKCRARGCYVITCELYDEADDMVVGCATCKNCQERRIFTRPLRRDEPSDLQEQGRPLRHAQT